MLAQPSELEASSDFVSDTWRIRLSIMFTSAQKKAAPAERVNPFLYFACD
jgi:hypothetical protein